MYTFEPEEKHAKAFGRNLSISMKDSLKVCKKIKGKPLVKAKKILNGLENETIHINGKYYTKAAGEIKNLIESCEKNADFLGLAKDNLKVHVSVHKGSNMRRRRRKAAFGNRMKSTNLEVILIQG